MCCSTPYTWLYLRFELSIYCILTKIILNCEIPIGIWKRVSYSLTTMMWRGSGPRTIFKQGLEPITRKWWLTIERIAKGKGRGGAKPTAWQISKWKGVKGRPKGSCVRQPLGFFEVDQCEAPNLIKLRCGGHVILHNESNELGEFTRHVYMYTRAWQGYLF